MTVIKDKVGWQSILLSGLSVVTMSSMSLCRAGAPPYWRTCLAAKAARRESSVCTAHALHRTHTLEYNPQTMYKHNLYRSVHLHIVFLRWELSVARLLRYTNAVSRCVCAYYELSKAHCCWLHGLHNLFCEQILRNTLMSEWFIERA